MISETLTLQTCAQQKTAASKSSRSVQGVLKMVSFLTSRLKDTLSNVRSFTRRARMSGISKMVSWFLSATVHSGSSNLGFFCWTQLSALRSWPNHVFPALKTTRKTNSSSFEHSNPPAGLSSMPPLSTIKTWERSLSMFKCCYQQIKRWHIHQEI